ncbi:MAG: DHHA1 domain-containing protein, partial [Dehalococcoidia bacterium]
AHAFKAVKGAEVYGSLGLGSTRFVGYETLQGESVVVGLLVEGVSTQQAREGEEAEVVTMETPFYPEGGGQVGDRGQIVGPQGKFLVKDTQMTMPGFIVHRGTVQDGVVAIGDPVRMRVDSTHRRDAARNHTATHLLHAALRQVLGEHVRQGGSLVAPDRLRFDFTHPVGLSRTEMLDVRNLVNEKIRADLHIAQRELSYNQAISEGALAFFGDKYGDVVRVVEMGNGGNFSFEVCGGTHVSSTGDVWYCQIVDEGSIGSGLRRVEAVTGVGAGELIGQRMELVDSLSRELQSPPSELRNRVSGLVSQLDSERKRAVGLERELARKEAEELLQQVQHVDGVNLIAARVKAPNVETMREMGDLLKDRLGSAVVVLASIINERPLFVAMVTPDLVAKGLHAGKIAKEVAAVTGGGGGGRPEMAQAGGKDKSKVSQALSSVAPAIQGVKG